MLSVIVTARKEEKSIAKALECIFNRRYSKINTEFEVLLVSPDDKTIDKSIETAKEYNSYNILKVVKDLGKGKPAALNMAFKQVTGDHLFLTDGDVYIGPNAIPMMLKHFCDKSVGVVSARPVSHDSKDNFMGYMGHLLADAAHHKRTIDLTDNPKGFSLKIIPKRDFFPATGYLMAIKKFDDISIPEDCLVDDAFISYFIYNKGLKIKYEPEAIVYVKYPKNLADYLKQKKRSTGGYVQLWKYGVVNKKTKSRTFFREIEYFWFPLKYASSFKELLWSLIIYPIRLYLWLMIFWERRIINKSFSSTWTRIESTK